MLRNRVAAIDHGPSRTAIGVFSHAADGRLTLLDFAWIPHADGESRAGGLPESLRAFLDDRATRRRFRCRLCALVPSGLPVLVKTLALPPLDAAKREAVLRFEAQRHLPVALDELVWRATAGVPRTDGGETTFAAVRRDEIEALTRAWAAAGWPVAAVVPSALVLPWAAGGAGRGGGVMAEATAGGCHVVAWAANGAIRRAVNLADPGAGSARDGTRIGEARLVHELMHARAAVADEAGAGVEPAVWLAGPEAVVVRWQAVLPERIAAVARRWDPASGYSIAGGGAVAAARGAEAPALFGAATVLGRGELPVNLAPPSAAGATRARAAQAAAVFTAAALLASPIGAAAALRHETARLRRETERWRAPLVEQRARAQQLAEIARERAELQAVVARSEAGRIAAQWWMAWLQELQAVSTRHPAVVLDRLAPESAETLVLAGRSRATAPTAGREEAVRQLRGWLADLRASPAVAAVLEERFENDEDGGLGFTVRLAMKPGRWW